MSRVLLQLLGTDGCAHLDREEYIDSQGSGFVIKGKTAASEALRRRLAAFGDPSNRSTPVLLLRVGDRVSAPPCMCMAT